MSEPKGHAHAALDLGPARRLFVRRVEQRRVVVFDAVGSSAWLGCRRAGCTGAISPQPYEECRAHEAAYGQGEPAEEEQAPECEYPRTPEAVQGISRWLATQQTEGPAKKPVLHVAPEDQQIECKIMPQQGSQHARQSGPADVRCLPPGHNTPPTEPAAQE